MATIGASEVIRTRTTPPWRYAIGMFGTSIPINMIKGSVLLFYVDILGLDIGFYAGVMVVYAIIDALDNPAFGYLSDRTRTRFGRRKPWLIIGAPLLAIGLVAYFSPPAGLTGISLVVWYAIFAIMSEMVDSMINANYGALLPELFPLEKARAKANSLRQGFQLVALVISLALTPLLTTSIFGTSKTTQGFTTTAIIYAILGAGVILLMGTWIHEPPSHAKAPKPKLWPTVKAILTNKWFWQIGFANACYGAGLALVLAGLQLYVKYSLGIAVAWATVLQATVILVAVGGLVLWTFVIRRKGAGWTWRVAFATYAVGFVPLFFAHDLISAILGSLVLGIGWAGMMSTNDLIVSRVIDEDAAGHGEHREGVTIASFGMFGRLNGMLSGFALASLSAMFGYHSGDDPGSNPALAWRVYMTVYPFILAVIGLAIAWFIKLPQNKVEPEDVLPEGLPQ